MANYTDETQVRLITGFNDGNKISATTINAAIGQADSIINAKIGKVYQLPLTSTPSLIAYCSLQIAAAILYMSEYGEETENSDKGWQKKYNHQIKILDDVMKRKAILIDDSTGEELPLTGLTEVASYPNNTSDVDRYDPTAAKFTRNSKY